MSAIRLKIKLACFSPLVLSLVVLLCCSPKLTAQFLYQDALKIAEVAKSGSIIPQLSSANPNFTLSRDGLAVEHTAGKTISLQESGTYQIDLERPSITQFLLKIGNITDTIWTSSRIRIISKPAYVYWESFGTRSPIELPKDFQVQCIGPCNTQDTLVQGVSRQAFSSSNAKDFRILIRPQDTLQLAPFERLYLVEQRNGSQAYEIRGERNQLEKPLQSVLKMWYQHIAYKDDNWDTRSLIDIRNQLLENPFLPNSIASLVPASNEQAGKYLKPKDLPPLLDWQKRLYVSKQEIDVSIQPELKFRPSQSQLVSAPQQVSQEAQQVYAADQRLGFSLNQAAILKGLASFIEGRAQEELNITFLNRMRSRIEKDTLLQVLFPNTTFLFRQIELDNYRFIMDNAKVVFTSDLENLGLNIYQAFEIRQFQDEFKYSSSLYFTALVLKMINMVYQDVPTDTILINSFLSLDKQRNQLQQEIEWVSAQKLLKDTSTLATFQKATQTYLDALIQEQDNIQELTKALQKEAKFLQDTLPYNNFLYEEAWTLSSDLAATGRGLDQWKIQQDDHKTQLAIELSGGYSREYILDHSTLDQYDDFFPIGQIDSLSLLVQGIQTLKSGALSNSLDYLKKQMVVLSEIQDDLLTLKGQWIKWEDTQLERRALMVYYSFEVLKKSLASEKARWSALPNAKSQADYLALEFLLESLEQDPIVSSQLRNLKRDLLGEPFEKELFLELVPQLENTFERFYYAKIQRHILQLEAQASNQKWALQKEVPTSFQQNAKNLEKAWPDLQKLFRAKEQAAITGTNFESLADSCKQFFTTLQLPAFEEGFTKRFDNPLWNLLSELRQFTYLDSLNATKQLVRLDSQIVSQQKRMGQLVDQENALQKQVANYQIQFTDPAIAKSRNQLQQFSAIMETGVHALQALQFQRQFIQTRALLDTSLKRTQISDLSSGIEILNQTDSLIIQKTFQQDTIQKKWVSFQEMEQNFKSDSLARSIYFGLLYQDIVSLPRFRTQNGASLNPQRLALLTTTLIQSLEAISALETKKAQLKAKGKKLSIMDYTSLIQHTLQVVTHTFNLSAQSNSKGSEQGLEKIGKQVLGQTAGMYQNLVDKNYSLAISNLAGLVQALVSDTDNKSFANEAQKIKGKLVTYGSFMAAVALAQSPDQVKTALETAAIDVGSSRIKRVNSWNLALNAYLGIGVGYENTGADQSGALINLSTPIGVSLSKSFGKQHSLSLFGSILDLGPIVTYDFQSGEAATDADLSFADFVAPGAFLFWNVGNTPFTMGFGVQRTTKLRAIGERQGRNTRVLGTFLVDVPVFNLFTRK